MKTLNAIAALLVAPLENRWDKCGQSIENRDTLGAVTHFAFMILYIMALTAATCGLVALACEFWVWLIVPALVVWLLAYYAGKKPQPPTILITHRQDAIEEVRARAKRAYPLMMQTAYLLFTDLCRYLPGLVAPFSMSAVTAPENFDITASLVTKFHFVLAKGQCSAPVSDVKEILDNIIMQRLRAQDLPISIPAIYTAADGSTWPGLVVDGVFDLGNQYRVDLVITNEAEVAALRAKGLSWSEDDEAADPQDPDL